MKSKKSYILIIPLGLLFITTFTGCIAFAGSTSNALQAKSQDELMYAYGSDGIELGRSSIGVEMAQTEANQRKLTKVQPAPQLDWSLERDNLIKRIKLMNDKNKISYIYLTSYGRVMAFYTIKGKISSVNSKLTTNMQMVNTYQSSTVLESPDLDGSYGTNGDGIFFFTTDGTYVEWNGEFMLCDKPLKLATQPELIRQVE